jgi:hypothetical protein
MAAGNKGQQSAQWLYIVLLQFLPASSAYNIGGLSDRFEINQYTPAASFGSLSSGGAPSHSTHLQAPRTTLADLSKGLLTKLHI